MFSPSTTESAGGFAPCILYRADAGGWTEFELVGLFATADEALAQALAAIEAIRAELRAPLPEGWTW